MREHALLFADSVRCFRRAALIEPCTVRLGQQSTLSPADLGCVRRVARNLVECIAVRDFQMSPVSALDDAARGQGPECSAHGLKRHSKVFTNIRPLHREIYLDRALTSAGLKVFQ